MNVDRLLRGTPSTVTMTFYNGSAAVNLDSPPTVTVYKADGTILTTGPATGPSSNVYSYTIPAQTNLNSFSMTWAGLLSSQPISSTSYAEVVGGYLFTIAELRNYDSSISSTSGVTRFPDAKLASERISVEEEFQDITGRSFTPRFMREDYADVGDGYIILRKPEAFSITKLTVDGVDRLSWVASRYVSYDTGDPFLLNLSYDALAILYSSRVTIEYEYGMQRVPQKIHDVGLKRAKSNLLGYNSAVDERATTLSVPEFGTMTLATPGRGGSETGIPDVDAVLKRFDLTGTGGTGGVY